MPSSVAESLFCGWAMCLGSVDGRHKPAQHHVVALYRLRKQTGYTNLLTKFSHRQKTPRQNVESHTTSKHDAAADCSYR